MKQVYNNIRNLRNFQGLSQKNVADDLGLSLTGYAKIERGETDIQLSRMVQIAEYYNIGICDLFNTKNPTKYHSESSSNLEYLKKLIEILENQIEIIKK